MHSVKNTRIKNDPVLNQIKWLIKKAVPNISSAHLCESIAFALGFNTWAALSDEFCRIGGIEKIYFSLSSFEKRIEQLAPSLVASKLSTSLINIQELLDSAYLPKSTNGKGYFTTEEMDVMSDNTRKKHDIYLIRQKEDLATRGISIASRSEIFGPFCMFFSWSLKLEGKAIKLRIIGSNSESRGINSIVGESWPLEASTVQAIDVLQALVKHWTKIVSSVSGIENAWIRNLTINLGSEMIFPSEYPLIITMNGPEIKISSRSMNTVHREEAVLFVESLAALGDYIASLNICGVLGEEWQKLRKSDPIVPIVDEEICENPGLIEEHASFYARYLSIDLESYKLAAYYQEAYRITKTYQHQAEKGVLVNGLSALILGTLPPAQEIMQLCKQAYDLEKQVWAKRKKQQVPFYYSSLEQALLSWLNSENNWCRSTIVYSKWPYRWDGNIKDLVNTDPQTLIGTVRKDRGNGRLHAIAQDGKARDGENLISVTHSNNNYNVYTWRVSEFALLNSII